MFDPIYVTEVLNDILSRHGLQLVLTPKEEAPKRVEVPSESSPKKPPAPASLREARISAGFTQAGAERELGFSKGTLSRWEAGIHSPRPIKLRQLCRLYGVNEGDIQIKGRG